MKPTIGRILHYVQKKSATFGGGIVHLPAIIVAVWVDTRVNLQVFTDGSNSEMDPNSWQNVKWATSAPLDESADPQPWTWHWPEREPAS
jgi:hypothetical protein